MLFYFLSSFDNTDELFTFRIFYSFIFFVCFRYIYMKQHSLNEHIFFLFKDDFLGNK